MSGPNVIQRDTIARQNPTGLVLPLPSPLLAMLPPDLQSYAMQWFIEPIQMLAVAVNGSQTGSFTTDKNHSFAAWYGSLDVRSSDNQTDRNTDPARFSMTDTQNLQYQPPGIAIPTKNAWGTAAQPAIWPAPLVVRPNSGIKLTVFNLSNANINNYDFAFIGVLIDMNAPLQ